MFHLFAIRFAVKTKLHTSSRFNAEPTLRGDNRSRASPRCAGIIARKNYLKHVLLIELTLIFFGTVMRSARLQ